MRVHRASAVGFLGLIALSVGVRTCWLDGQPVALAPFDRMQRPAPSAALAAPLPVASSTAVVPVLVPQASQSSDRVLLAAPSEAIEAAPRQAQESPREGAPIGNFVQVLLGAF